MNQIDNPVTRAGKIPLKKTEQDNWVGIPACK